MKKWVNKNINSIDHECIVTKEGSNRYYICIPCDTVQKKIERPYNIVSLDPGVKTFQTFYSPDGIHGKLGDKINKTVSKINKVISKLQSKITNSTCKTKRNLKKRCFLLRTKIKNKINDLHWKTASFLCKNFENIIIPPFETAKMAKKGKRKINKKTTNEMLSLSHYKFRQRLIYKSKCYTNCEVHVSREDYTSQTCTNCGGIQKSLGGKRTYTCKECDMILDRDLNGARNILIKVLSSKPSRSDLTGAFIGEI
jgi:putative transposase